MLGLKLMAHIILLLFVPGEDADFLQIGIQKVLQNGGTKRTGTTGNHKGCVIKYRHFFLQIYVIKIYPAMQRLIAICISFYYNVF